MPYGVADELWKRLPPDEQAAIRAGSPPATPASPLPATTTPTTTTANIPPVDTGPMTDVIPLLPGQKPIEIPGITFVAPLTAPPTTSQTSTPQTSPVPSSPATSASTQPTPTNPAPGPKTPPKTAKTPTNTPAKPTATVNAVKPRPASDFTASKQPSPSLDHQGALFAREHLHPSPATHAKPVIQAVKALPARAITTQAHQKQVLEPKRAPVALKVPVPSPKASAAAVHPKPPAQIERHHIQPVAIAGPKRGSTDAAFGVFSAARELHAFFETHKVESTTASPGSRRALALAQRVERAAQEAFLNWARPNDRAGDLFNLHNAMKALADYVGVPLVEPGRAKDAYDYIKAIRTPINQLIEQAFKEQTGIDVSALDALLKRARELKVGRGDESAGGAESATTGEGGNFGELNPIGPDLGAPFIRNADEASRPHS